jgi:hypothetical protein
LSFTHGEPAAGQYFHPVRTVDKHISYRELVRRRGCSSALALRANSRDLGHTQTSAPGIDHQDACPTIRKHGSNIQRHGRCPNLRSATSNHDEPRAAHGLPLIFERKLRRAGSRQSRMHKPPKMFSLITHNV